MISSDKCDYCGEHVKSPYSMRHNGGWYSGHKRCMGAPMIRKLSNESAKTLPNVALTGKLRSGKDEVARYLCEKYGYTRFAFGDELKRYAHELFGESERKPRELYQWFGQTMRQRDPDVWVRKCFDRISEPNFFRTVGNPYLPPRPVVIMDLRQPNEYDRCCVEGYVIIRVNCPDEIRLDRARAAGDAFTDADLRHETEQYVDTFAVDYELDNSGTLAELYAQIDVIMRNYTEHDSTYLSV